MTFAAGGCLWSLRGCLLAEEPPKASFWDGFWMDLGLILGACGGHCAQLFVALFVVRFWSGCGVAFSSMLDQLWITFRSHFGGFWVSRLESANGRGLHFEGPEGVRMGTFGGPFFDAISDPPIFYVFVRFWVAKEVHFGGCGDTFSHLLLKVFLETLFGRILGPSPLKMGCRR